MYYDEEYTLNLQRDFDNEEEFERDFDNVGRVMVFDEKGNDITKKCRVQIMLTKNGMIGLGTELIRMAHNFRDGSYTHIDPAQVGNIFIMLHPESCELIVCCADFPAVTELFEGSSSE